ncbi:hypothetical protein IFM89_025398 [Coptis chinensis]|uniref:BHLH domain-containing protein n=1 Tax=Coptis chinensis TaxID=261450 RepID=A0A835HB92_9MAGN|nr:hypothetical protein IFM89_025398 [Coptis chinensis]
MDEKDDFDLEKRSADHLNYHSSKMLSESQFGAANDLKQSGLEPTIDIWRHQNSQNLGFDDSNLHASRSGFLQTGGGMMPQTLPEFPTDSSFIERAARFSCFNGGSFSDLGNHLSFSELMNLSANGLKPALGLQPRMTEENMNEAAQVDQREVEGTSIKETVVEFLRAPSYEAKDSDSDRQMELSMLEVGAEPAGRKGLGLKKRKRNGQDTEVERKEGAPRLQGETAKNDSETKQKKDQNPSTTAKATKHSKDSSKNSDAANQDYIHVRARRGQATNSHSLAERVRREKISERMKFLQDLVPGCNKVTGKAVMLDEIINYVQSLQRQVEFLSMKLATVNPMVDLNIEELLAKDIHQSRGGQSLYPFSPEMNMVPTQLHPSQQGLVQVGMSGTENPSDALRRTINPQLMAMNGAGYKDSNQIPNVWDNELNNALQMNFGNGAPFNSQEIDGSVPHGHMKVEL